MKDQNRILVFSKKNYKIMFLGLIVLFSGFVIMSLDQEEFGFGFLGLTLGPIVVLSGFIIQFFAILTKNKKEDTPTKE
ncbi:DUF3098 domain-containing protein [Flexithrix dorotheae]|uniref:DUF3098 domain-containing protein n=1 Tax=Flexithrix dorotheae TaxID=70993 RepID=UPI00036CAD4A|nr:DUF3098 domain-containing protein [Flexithrix dorotheae]